MKAQETTVTVKHKKNGIVRELTPTQLDLMGKNNRKQFKQTTPAEAGKDANAVAEQTEAQRLDAENASLRKQLEEALKGTTTAAPEGTVTRTEQQLENEGKRAENAQLKADLSSATSALQTDSAVVVEDADEDDDQEEDSDDDQDENNDADPNPELTALRKSYEEATGKKPGRLGIDKMNEGIAAALAAKGQGAVQPK